MEAARMNLYYRHSLLTIAADTATGDHVGFMHTRRNEVVLHIKIPFLRDRSVDGHVYIAKEDQSILKLGAYPPRQIQASDPLHARAWTLQEWLLSPRTLHYTSTGVMFECGVCKFDEFCVVPKKAGIRTLEPDHYPIDLRSVFLPYYSNHLKKLPFVLL